METSSAKRGGLTPTKARTVPNRMAWVNGRGYQRACSYRHHAAVAEMPVAFLLLRPGRPDVVLFVPALTSRTAGYVTRMSGAVGGALSDGRPYPYGFCSQLNHPYLINAKFPLILCMAGISISLNTDKSSSALREMRAPDPASMFK